MRNMVDYIIVAYISLSVIPICYGVGIEYYDDRGMSDIPTEVVISSDAIRTDNEDNFENSSVRRYIDTDYIKSISAKMFIDSDDNSMPYNIAKHQTIGKSLNKSFVNNCRSHISSVVKENIKMFSNTDAMTLTSDTLEEYEYIYDDHTKSHILLRQYSQKSDQDTETNLLEISKKNPLTEFYNLEPAIRHVNLSHNFSKSNNLWYVQEDLPCWELPILYGELDKKKKYSDVFLMHGGEVKNVIEKNDNDDWSSNKHATPPLTYYTSKWCTVEPCYGDHTLCLFSDKTTSSLCGPDYEVNVPKILEQTALVNTLNTMRNKIANGKSTRYSHLPPAANMKQILYDYDLEKIAKVWLHQCLPGPAPCSALDGTFVTQLECTKYAKHCCLNSYKTQFTKCTPKPECFVLPVIGCLHVWFWSASDNLTITDVQCGHTSVLTYSTAQLLWATTNKIGCAYAKNTFGDVRVVCNFSPGAPYIIDSKYYCGIVGYKEKPYLHAKSIINTKILMSLGINLDSINKRSAPNITAKSESTLRGFDSFRIGEHSDNYWGVNILSQIYKEGWVRKQLKDYSNGTKSLIAGLVVKYEFIEQSGARCDSDEPIYIIGEPGSLCVERGRRYQALCHDFRDPTPGYRIVAVIAPIALFSLILYDLFSGVVRQTNY